jgi:hypothetical protein
MGALGVMFTDRSEIGDGETRRLAGVAHSRALVGRPVRGWPVA